MEPPFGLGSDAGTNCEEAKLQSLEQSPTDHRRETVSNKIYIPLGLVILLATDRANW